MCNSIPCVGPHTAYGTSIDFGTIGYWEELLERALEEVGCRNRQARLAVAALCVQRCHRTVILSKRFCGNCYENEVTDGHHTFGLFDSPEVQGTGRDTAYMDVKQANVEVVQVIHVTRMIWKC